MVFHDFLAFLVALTLIAVAVGEGNGSDISVEPYSRVQEGSGFLSPATALGLLILE